MSAVVIGTPQRSLAVELLQYRKDHARGIVDRCRIAAPVIRQQYRLALLESLQHAP